jgi:hypothetical protein
MSINDSYQVAVARTVLSYSRANKETQEQLLDSYKHIIDEFEENERKLNSTNDHEQHDANP